jgi:hypothetical protein
LEFAPNFSLPASVPILARPLEVVFIMTYTSKM